MLPVSGAEQLNTSTTSPRGHDSQSDEYSRFESRRHVLNQQEQVPQTFFLGERLQIFEDLRHCQGLPALRKASIWSA